jgi:hypothetical protein
MTGFLCDPIMFKKGPDSLVFRYNLYVCLLVNLLVGPSVGPSPYCFFFKVSAVCGRTDLKLGGDLLVDLLFLFLLFFLLSSSNSFFSSSFSSSSSSEFEFIGIYLAKQQIWRGTHKQQVYALDPGCIEGPNSQGGPTS